jgi:tRNA(fMet)-specific endonuclease VapC
MKYLLDSNAVIALLDRRDSTIVARVADCDEGELGVSAVSLAEVAVGSINGKPPSFKVLDAFLEEVILLPFDEAAARAYARLPFKRGSFDRLIAAHALSRDLIVVTGNGRDFADVPGLKVENWTIATSL